MKSQGRASEPAQAKISTRRLEEQPAKGKVVETADSPVRHTVRLTTADRGVTILVFLFQFPGVNVGSADGGSGVNIQPKASFLEIDNSVYLELNMKSYFLARPVRIRKNSRDCFEVRSLR